MYNSSIKGQSHHIHFLEAEQIEIPHKIFFNDMSKTYMRDEFKECDVIFSEISWRYGYGIFNERAENSPNNYTDYLNNIQKLIKELGIPSFVVCGKPVAKYFAGAKAYPISIRTSGTNMHGCQLYVWNYNYLYQFKDTKELIAFLSKTFEKCLDFSCGYGEHLLMFKDFIGCDINKDCLTYLSILETERKNGKTKN